MMASGVIDLTTSSPEPDEEPPPPAYGDLRAIFSHKPSAVAVGWSDSVDDVDQSPQRAANAARAALENFLPRKQKELVKKKQWNRTAHRPLDIRNDGEGPRAVQSALPSYTVSATSPNSRQTPPAGIQSGSLASLLQGQGIANLPTPTSLTSPYRLSGSTDTQQRSQSEGQDKRPLNGGWLRNTQSLSPAHRRVASALPPPRPIVDTYASFSQSEDRDNVKDLKKSRPTLSSPLAPTNGHDADSCRPFKRRRTNEVESHTSSSAHKRSPRRLFSSPTRPINLPARVAIRSASPTNHPPPRLTQASSSKLDSIHAPDKRPLAGSTEENSNMSIQQNGLTNSHEPALLAELLKARRQRGGVAHESHSEVRNEQVTNFNGHIRNNSSRDKHDSPPQSRPAPPILSSKNVEAPAPKVATTTAASADIMESKAGENYTAEDDALLIKLKQVDQLSWAKICLHFPNRSYASLQVHYVSLKRKTSTATKPAVRRLKFSPSAPEAAAATSVSLPRAQPLRAQRKRRGVEESVLSGFVSWADVKSGLLDGNDLRQESPLDPGTDQQARFEGEPLYPSSVQRILRSRELGVGNYRNGPSSKLPIPDALKEHVFSDIGPVKYYKGTSGDVSTLAWAPDGNLFAAGSIAISDERSMQYNRPYNLLLGDCERGMVQELPEHHVPRPKVQSDGSNVNALPSMHETQESRLFMTVAGVQFSADGSTLYSAGSDRKVRAYSTQENAGTCLYELDHPAPLDLLSVHGSENDVLATACHQSTDGSIRVYQGRQRVLSLSPSRVGQQTERAIYPSALRWGAAWSQAHFLLAGFSIDCIDAERDIAGETCLWNIAVEKRIEISGVTRNVFDIAWNPSPSLRSTTFAVASARGSENSRGTRTVIQCFAPGPKGLSRVIEWECPAFDINDVVYCQHDDNLIAAGATDGRIYIWDQRFASRTQAPLHILDHGDTLNILDDDREREIADTGVRFLSWGATSSRLYSGSSDGVVKVWNPYQCTANARVKDIATFSSAVMSGAFTPDYRDLLIGEDQGRINLLSVGYEQQAVRAMQRFELQTAPLPMKKEDPFLPARELLDANHIVVSPMGDLPKFQAVQGPNYHGPFFAPSEEEYEQTLKHLDLMTTQTTRLQRLGISSEEPAMQRARTEAHEVAARVEAMEKKQEEGEILDRQAQATQSAFRARAKAHLKREDDPCLLDCNYLPANNDNDGAVLDSCRSGARIPGILTGLGPLLDTSTMTPEDAIEAGLTQKCIACLGPASKPPKGKLALCERCSCNRSGLTTTCEKCSAPIRPPSNDSEAKLCEKCNFGCFRCGRRAVVWHDARISCKDCDMVWKAGVLGYEMLSPGTQKQRYGASPQRLKKSATYDLDDDDDDDDDDEEEEDLDELGNGEREHYASIWK